MATIWPLPLQPGDQVRVMDPRHTRFQQVGQLVRYDPHIMGPKYKVEFPDTQQQVYLSRALMMHDQWYFEYQIARIPLPRTEGPIAYPDSIP